ncbi:MAG: CBS domain-containing protein [Acidimicrobiia bacterium]|nr:CBS domain-containing protein [Acidimicrobiia bacterium]
MQVGALVGGKSEVVGPETPLFVAAESLIENGIGSLAVVDGRELAGIFTERDLVRATAKGADPQESVVRDWMTAAPDTIGPDVDVDEAAAWLLEMGYRHLPVMEGDELLGIVSIRDLLWAISSES